MGTAATGIVACSLALGLLGCVTLPSASAAEAVATTGPVERPDLPPVDHGEPGEAAAAPPAAPPPARTTAQKLFGTFSRYKSYGDGATYTYQLVEKDGEKLYCQQEVITGTRVGKKGVCLTLQQMEAREEARRRNAEQFLRQGENSRTNPPPRDSNGGRYNNAVGGTNLPTP